MSFVAQRALPLLLLPSLLLGAQTQKSAPSDGTPTFRADTRIVLLDVVVTDPAGHPIHGLKPENFSIYEDGRPQSVSSFDEQGPDIAVRTQPVPVNLLANEYTNYTVHNDPGALTVVLVDSVDSSREDLTNAKEQLLKFLKKLPAGKQVAIYALGERLRMLQSFTADSNALLAAAQKLSTVPLALYGNNRELSARIGELKESGIANNPKAFRAALGTLGQEYDSKIEMRTQDALEGLTQVARALAGMPGRKNLIWLSGGFPFDTSDTERFQRVAGLLATTRIAVYPVDVRRIVLMSADAQTRDTELYAPVQTQSYETIAALNEEDRALGDTLEDFARLTGGRAYLNKNDLAHSIADAVDNGSSYYSIAYRPTNKNWNGKYRRVAIKINRPGARVLCRAGYYAVTDPLNAKEDPDRSAALAMQRESPISTQLIMKARVVPPDSAGGTVSIDILIDAHALKFNQLNDQHRAADVEFLAVASNDAGKQCGSFVDTFRQPLTAADLQSLLRTGLQLHRDMTLPAGSYHLRLGVMDRLASRIGTLDVPLTIVASQKDAAHQSESGTKE